MLLANQFGVALHESIQSEQAVGGLAWTISPFSGEGARGDGFAALSYRLDRGVALRDRSDAYMPMLAAEDYAPLPGTAVQRLVIEIDSGTETQKQLEQRARHWRKKWEQTHWPPATHAVFLWITTGGSARLETIWRAWTHYALLPAFFTTVETLTLGTGGHWHPWNPRRSLPDGRTVWVWRDMYGRPRSLCPWEGDEPTWRFEQPVAVIATSLQASSTAWWAGCEIDYSAY